MHVEIQRADLARILTTVSKVVEARNTYPILANVLLSASKGNLVVRGTNLDIEISSTAEAKCKPGSTTVPAKTLAEIVKKMAGDTVTMELKDENLIVKSGRSRFSLAVMSPDAFPTLNAGDFTTKFSADLAALFAPVKFAISNEETRYYLNGIFLHPVGEQIRSVATDGHRMARFSADLPDGAADMAGIIVPTKAVAVLSGFSGDVDVEVSATKIRVTSGDVVVTSKLIEGTFPDYDRVTPKNNEKIAVVARSALSAAVGLVSTIASDRGGKAVKLAFAADALSLEVKNPDHGTATEELAATYSAEPLDIGYNAKYLQDVLGAVQGSDVTFELNDGGSPTVIRGEGNLLCVLMPMRVV